MVLQDAAAEKAGLPVHSLRGFRAARNYLVRLYKLDPSRYLTATESRCVFLDAVVFLVPSAANGRSICVAL